MLNLGGNVDFSRKPRALCCYICGREYGTNSLAIHLPQCQEIWIKRESLKPKNERRPLPPPPRGFNNISGKMSAKDMESYNQNAFENYNNVALVPCAYCGRTFEPDRLKIHNKSCTADNPARKIGTARLSQKTTSAASPDRVMSKKGMIQPAYNAGNTGPTSGSMFNSEQYMSSTDSSSSSRVSTRGGGGGGITASPTKRGVSFASDVTSSDHQIHRLPTSAAPLKKGYVMPDEFEDEAELVEEIDTSALVPCGRCGRRFAADRIDKHASVCKGGSSTVSQKTPVYDPAASAASGKAKPQKNAAWRHKHKEFQASIQYAKKMNAVLSRGGNIVNELPPPPPSLNPDYVSCPSCGRRFNQTAADRHIPLCAGIMNKPKSLVRTSTSSLAISRGQAPALAHAHNAYSSAGTISSPSRMTTNRTSVHAGNTTAHNTARNILGGNVTTSNNNARMKSPPGQRPGQQHYQTANTTTSTPLRRTATASSSSTRMHSPTSTMHRYQPATSSSTHQNNIKKTPQRQPTSSGPRFCSDCGTERVNMARFCHECGMQH